MRLIDADELKLSLCKECTLYPDKCLKEECDWNSIYHIDHAKTIEAIPIKHIVETINTLISVRDINSNNLLISTELSKQIDTLTLLINGWSIIEKRRRKEND